MLVLGLLGNSSVWTFALGKMLSLPLHTKSDSGPANSVVVTLHGLASLAPDNYRKRGQSEAVQG